MSVLVDKNTRLVGQGITGSAAHFIRGSAWSTCRTLSPALRLEKAGNVRWQSAGIRHGLKRDRKQRATYRWFSCPPLRPLIQFSKRSMRHRACRMHHGRNSGHRHDARESANEGKPSRLIGPNCPASLRPALARSGSCPVHPYAGQCWRHLTLGNAHL